MGNYSFLGYDCDGNKINEFRILRFPFSADIENWDEAPNVDPRFYCLVKNTNGEILGISVYDDYNSNAIRKKEGINSDEEIPTVIKSVIELSYYEVAFCGITGLEWYYDRDQNELRKKLETILNNQQKIVRKK